MTINELKLEYAKAMKRQAECAAALVEDRAALDAECAALERDFKARCAAKLEAEATATVDLLLADRTLRTAVENHCRIFNIKTIDEQLGASETVKFKFDEAEAFAEWAATNAPILISRPVVIDEKSATSLLKEMEVLPPGVSRQSKWSARLTKIAEWFEAQESANSHGY